MKRESEKPLSSQLRHRVWIQTLSPVADGEGGFENAWADTTETWAAVLPMRADQVMEYRTKNVEASHMIKVRGGVSVSESQRIRFGSRYFEILTVENAQERDVVQWVMCKERR